MQAVFAPKMAEMYSREAEWQVVGGLGDDRKVEAAAGAEGEDEPDEDDDDEDDDDDDEDDDDEDDDDDDDDEDDEDDDHDDEDDDDDEDEIIPVSRSVGRGCSISQCTLHLTA